MITVNYIVIFAPLDYAHHHMLPANMKIKMPCKLCEMSSLDHSKLGMGDCTHSPFVLPQIPGLSPFQLGLGVGQMQNGPFLLPQIRDVMLAAYLFRGKIFR